MENQEAKKRGRPKKYHTEEERLQAKRKDHNKYMSNKEWRCVACGGYNYGMAGKTCHLKTAKHKRNAGEN